MKKRLHLIASFAVAAGVGGYAWWRLGRVTASAIFLGIATFVLGWVIWTLLRAAAALVKEPAAVETARATGRRRKELEREKTMLLKALKELEFDHEMGKISDADFREIGGQYRARATRVLRQLDTTAGVVDYRDLVERDVRARVKERGAGDAKVKTGTSTSTSKSTSTSAERPRCGKCSTENDSDAEFCKRCGNALRATGGVAKP